jgi:DNA-binding MarR family transcriptional regulator
MADHENSKNGAELGAQAEQIEHDLGAIRRALRRPLDAEVAKGELTAPQTLVIREVVRSDGINLRDLSRVVNLAHSTVSGIVDRLEMRGLIERRSDPTDGRFSCIYATAPVRDFIRRRIPKLSRGPLLTALELATPAERKSISAALRRLRELLGELPD